MSIFHRHHWDAIAAQKLMAEHFETGILGAKSWDGTPVKVGPDSPITEVLLKCSCSDVRTKTLDGHWTIEEVNRGAA